MTRQMALGLALALGLSTAAPVLAEGTVKIGVILPYSGQFADTGVQLDNGIKLFMEQHGDEVAGKKIEVIRKDVGGIAPDVAKRLAQELVVREGADILVGFALTPNAMAAAGVSAQAKRLMVVMNAATSAITEASPYVVRTSVTTPQINSALGKWVAEHGVKNVYTIATDYGPGHDAQTAFEKAFTEAGGTVVGSDRTPVQNPDFSAYVQRVKDANPEAVYIWVPGGAQPPAIGKALAERGLTPPTTRVFGQGELVLPEALQAMGDTAIGIITGFHYTVERDDPVNKAFVQAYQDAYNRLPDIYSVGGYDGMQAVYAALEKTGGDADGDKLVEAIKGMRIDSPRGPISIDPETRDIVQTVWIREVQKVGDTIQNVIIDKVENVKDPLHGTK